MIKKQIKYKYKNNIYDSFAHLKMASPHISFPPNPSADILQELKIERVEEFPPIDRCKYLMKSKAGLIFAGKRDSVRWVEFDNVRYGIDCASEDIVNFYAAKSRLQDALNRWDKQGEEPKTPYKVWINETSKDLILITMDQLSKIESTVADSQFAAYYWYQTIETKIKAAQSVEELLEINLEDV